jgi:hypothetical protein
VSRSKSKGRPRRTLGIGIVLILLGATAAYIATTEYQGSVKASSASTSASLKRALTNAVDYLLAGYNPHLGLIPETPGSSVYWLYSDNFLAARALLQYGQGNGAILAIGQNISATVQRDSALTGADNQYATSPGGGPCQIHNASNYVVSSSDGVEIKTTLNNGTGYLSENQYADIAFLTAICLHNQGNATQAMAYRVGWGLFDGIGFNDLPRDSGPYQTYKVALYAYAGDILKQPTNVEALTTLMRMQAQNGGFYTGYDSSYSSAGTSTNTETTSLAILALYNYLER